MMSPASVLYRKRAQTNQGPTLIYTQPSIYCRHPRAASQPPLVRNYTVAGYEKRPTPPGLLAVLQDYFERHKAEYTREVRTSCESCKACFP